MFREVGQENGDVEADVLGRTVESIRELIEVNFTVLIGVHAHHHVIDLLAVQSHVLIDSALSQQSLEKSKQV